MGTHLPRACCRCDLSTVAHAARSCQPGPYVGKIVGGTWLHCSMTSPALDPGGDRSCLLSLDAQQVAVVKRAEQRAGCLLVTGGPGSGKTMALVAAVAGLVAGGVPLSDIVVLTHARPAAQRLRRQIMAAVGVTQVDLHITTAHGWCQALLNRYGQPDKSVRLLSAPEQEYRVRELVQTVPWPDDMGQAIGTVAFAGQLRFLLARARQLGLDPDDLAAAGRAAGRADWVAAAGFFGVYLDVIDAEGALDYAELIHRCRVLLADDAVRAGVAAHTKALLVDEFAECDESVVALIRDVWRAGVPVTAFADPSTQVFGFRGAWPAAVRRFPTEFADAAGPAPVIEFEGNRRDISRREAWLAGASADEATMIARLLWAAHSDTAWDGMAVVGRAGGPDLLRLAKDLAGAGIPVRLEGEVLALADVPAVEVLIGALRLVVAIGAGTTTAEQWLSVLCSPVVGLDELDLRRLARSLAPADDWRAAVLAIAGTDAPGDLPDDLHAVWQRLAHAVSRLRELADQAEGPVDELAWGVWTSGDWPQRLRAASLSRAEDALRADRDLDAVIALFDLMGVQPLWRGTDGVEALAGLVAQQVVQRNRAREADDPLGVVTVLSAYQAKGRQWPVVVVTGASEGAWPNDTVGVSLLEPERLSAQGSIPPVTRRESLAAERRLFTLATSRATNRLIVTGAPSGDDEVARPSRFLREIGLEARLWRRDGDQGRGVVGELRTAAISDQPPGVVDAAVEGLRRLQAAQLPDGRPAVPAADPRTWWWVGGPTYGVRALAEPGRPVRIAAGSIGLAMDCPRAWFLRRQGGGEPPSSPGADFGRVVHALFHEFADSTPSPDELRIAIDGAWGGVDHPIEWRSNTQRLLLDDIMRRYFVWRDNRPGRRLLGTEIPFSHIWATAAGDVQVTGQVDRLEMDEMGRLVVIDFKTGRGSDARPHVDQVGVYDLAVRSGVFDELAPGVRKAASPELVWPIGVVRRTDIGFRVDQVAACPDDDPDRVVAHLARVVEMVRSERFDATPGDACRYCLFWAGCPAIPGAPAADQGGGQ